MTSEEFKRIRMKRKSPPRKEVGIYTLPVEKRSIHFNSLIKKDDRLSPPIEYYLNALRRLRNG